MGKSGKKQNQDLKGTAAERRARAAAAFEAEERARRKRAFLLQGGVGLAVVVVVVGIVVGVLALGGNDGPTSVSSDKTPSAVNADGAITVGDPDAKVTVQVVEDFQCPVCKAFEEAAGPQLAEWEAGSDVKVEYRGIAFLDRMSSTEYSSRALNASACVMEDGADVWKKFHDALYANQPAEGGDGLTDDQLVDYATQAGADTDRVRSCVEDGTYRDWAEATTNKSSEDGITGTPTVFVNGTKLESNDPAELTKAVDAALAG